MSTLASAVSIGILAAILPARAAAQGEAGGHVQVDSIAALPADVGTLDGIIRAFYEVISGPAGQPRQWARDRTLYAPGTRLTSISVHDGKVSTRAMTHQEFVDRNDAALVASGFFEEEIHRETRRFGNIAHIWSSYAMRSTPDGPVFGRGINSIELRHDGQRWWITSAAWDGERPDNPIPPEYGG